MLDTTKKVAQFNLLCVPPSRVSEAWPYVSRWIRAAMERADLGSFRAIEAQVLSGGYLLWLVADGRELKAAVVTELLQTEWRKVCNIIACGGSHMNEWLHLIEKIENYARAEGCSAVDIVGRDGWEKMLPTYRRKYVILEKAL